MRHLPFPSDTGATSLDCPAGASYPSAEQHYSRGSGCTTATPCTPPPPARTVPEVPPAASRRGTSFLSFPNSCLGTPSAKLSFPNSRLGTHRARAPEAKRGIAPSRSQTGVWERGKPPPARTVRPLSPAFRPAQTDPGVVRWPPSRGARRRGSREWSPVLSLSAAWPPPATVPVLRPRRFGPVGAQQGKDDRPPRRGVGLTALHPFPSSTSAREPPRLPAPHPP